MQHPCAEWRSLPTLTTIPLRPNPAYRAHRLAQFSVARKLRYTYNAMAVTDKKLAGHLDAMRTIRLDAARVAFSEAAERLRA